MKFIKLTSSLSKKELIELLKNHDAVNENVIFNEKYGKPVILVKEKGDRISLTCKMVGGPSADNGFIVGTFFRGKFSVKNEETVLRGFIMTAPFYHLALLLMTGFFIYKCISLGGFNPVPVILLFFSYFLFKSEYKKQGIISRYLVRAFRKSLENKKTR